MELQELANYPPKERDPRRVILQLIESLWKGGLNESAPEL